MDHHKVSMSLPNDRWYTARLPADRVTNRRILLRRDMKGDSHVPGS